MNIYETINFTTIMQKPATRGFSFVCKFDAQVDPDAIATGRIGWNRKVAKYIGYRRR